MSLGEVCMHGSLKRSCLVCEREAQLRAADELAKAVDEHCYEGHRDGEAIYLKSALAAYEKVRGTK